MTAQLRALAGALALVVLAALAPEVAAASVTHQVALQVRDEQARLVGSFTGTLRFDGPRTYSARICAKDELKDSRGPYFHFEYLYADGAWHVTRTWRNSEGAGSTVCHEASVNWPPDIDGIWIRASVDGLGTSAKAFYDNPYASPPPRPVDADGDGFATAQDCNDGDAAIRPGAGEVRGNAVDENCDGRAEDFERITASVSSAWVVRERRITVRRLLVRGAPADAAVAFRCSGPGCPVRRTSAGKPRRGRVNLRQTLGRRGRRFRAGQRLEVRITAPQRIGKLVRYRLRARRVPTARVLCLRPGAARPQRCS